MRGIFASLGDRAFLGSRQQHGMSPCSSGASPAKRGVVSCTSIRSYDTVVVFSIAVVSLLLVGHRCFSSFVRFFFLLCTVVAVVVFVVLPYRVPRCQREA